MEHRSPGPAETPRERPKVEEHPRTADGPEHIAAGEGGLQAAISRAASAHKARNENVKLVEDNEPSTEQYDRDRARSHEDIGIPYIHSRAIIEGKDEHGKPIVELEADQQLREAIENGKRLILMVGNVGTGKTLSAMRWVEDRIDARYVKARRLCSFVERYDEDRARLGSYLQCKTLVIDEIGTERDADIFTLADHLHTRYEAGLVTVGIANLDVAAAMTRYDEPIARRLWAMGQVIECTKIVCPGQQARVDDARKNKKQRRG